MIFLCHCVGSLMGDIARVLYRLPAPPGRLAFADVNVDSGSPEPVTLHSMAVESADNRRPYVNRWPMTPTIAQ
jgi:hypothetical protein